MEHDPEYIKSIVKYTDQGIPKIMHQIWINESGMDFPEHWKISPQKWKEYHPDYIYILWEKDSSVAFVEKYFPQYLELYNSFEHVIQRCDLIRYMFLYKFGGIYCDMDNYPLENIEKYLDKDVDAYFVEMMVLFHKTINDNLIICRRDVEMFQHIIENIDENSKLECSTKLICISYTNGFSYIKKVFEEGKYKMFVLPYEKFNPYSLGDDDFSKPKPGAVIMSTQGGSWYSWDMKTLIFLSLEIKSLKI